MGLVIYCLLWLKAVATECARLTFVWIQDSSSSSDAQLLRKFYTKLPTVRNVSVFTKNLASSPHRFESIPHSLNFQSKFWIQHFCVCLRSNKERHRHQNGCNRQQRWSLLKTVTKIFFWWNFRFLCVDIHGVFPAFLAVSKKRHKTNSSNSAVLMIIQLLHKVLFTVSALKKLRNEGALQLVVSKVGGSPNSLRVYYNPASCIIQCQ